MFNQYTFLIPFTKKEFNIRMKFIEAWREKYKRNY